MDAEILNDLLDTPTVFDPEHEDNLPDGAMNAEKRDRVSTLLGMVKGQA